MTRSVQTLIVGGGPAGMAVLSAADKFGCLPELIDAGLMIVERSEAIGSGLLGRYTIRSDSTAETFLTAVNQSRIPALRAQETHSIVKRVTDYIGTLGVPLPIAGEFLTLVSQHLATEVTARGGSVLTGTEALFARRTNSGDWEVALRHAADGREETVRAHAIVIATGGHQPDGLIVGKRVAGIPIVERYASKLLGSDAFLATSGLDRARAMLAGKPTPRIAVLGGSTSAVAALNKLIREESGFSFADGGLALLHRTPLRIFYPSIEAAHAEGYRDFGPDDICPISGFVYRLAGFRLEARALIAKMLGVNGAEPDPRIRLHGITGDGDAEARDIMDKADLIIAALGYRPHALPLFDATGQLLPLHARIADNAPMVDGECRVMMADRAPVPGVYGIGLAAGFVPHGTLGGEPSFRGQANGLWLWQNDVGQRIVDQLLDRRQPERAVA